MAPSSRSSSSLRSVRMRDEEEEGGDGSVASASEPESVAESPENDGHVGGENLERLTVKKLKERLKQRGIKPQGRKADLIAQLRAALDGEKEQPETEESSPFLLSPTGESAEPAPKAAVLPAPEPENQPKDMSQSRDQEQRAPLRSKSPTPQRRNTRSSAPLIDASLRKIAVYVPGKVKAKRPRRHTITFDCSSATARDDVLRSIEGLLASNGHRYKHYYLQNAHGEVQVLSQSYLENAPLAACPSTPRGFCFHIRTRPVRNFRISSSFRVWSRTIAIAAFVSAAVYMLGLLLFGKTSWQYHIETFIFKGDSTGGYFIGRLLFSLLEMKTGCDLHPASSNPCIRIAAAQPYVMYPILWAAVYLPCVYLVSIALVTLAPIRRIFKRYDRQLFAVPRKELSDKSATAAQKRSKLALKAQKSWMNPPRPAPQRSSQQMEIPVAFTSKTSSLSLRLRVASQIVKRYVVTAWVKPAIESWTEIPPAVFGAIIVTTYALHLLHAGPFAITLVLTILSASATALLAREKLEALAENARASPSWTEFVSDVSQSCPPQGWMENISVVARDASRVSLAFPSPPPQHIRKGGVSFHMPVTSFIVEAKALFSEGSWKTLRAAKGSGVHLDLGSNSGNFSFQSAAFLLRVFTPISFVTTLVYAPRSWYFSPHAYVFGISIKCIGVLFSLLGIAKYCKNLLASMSKASRAPTTMTVSVDLPMANTDYELRVRPRDVFNRKTSAFDAQGEKHTVQVKTLKEQSRAVVVFSNKHAVRTCVLRWNASDAVSKEWFRTACAALVDSVPNDDSFFHLLTGKTLYMPPEWLETSMFLPDISQKRPLNLGAHNQLTPGAAYKILSATAPADETPAADDDDRVPIVALQPIKWTTQRPRRQRGLPHSPFISNVYIIAVVAGRIMHWGLVSGTQKLCMDFLAGIFISSFLVLLNAAIDGRIVPWRRPTDIL